MKSKYRYELIGEKTIFLNEESTLLNASLSAGIPHYHACGGNARCSTCRVFVVEGVENLSIRNEAEITLSETKKFPENVRLACQTKITGETVKVKRIIKDDFDAELYVYNQNCEVFQNAGKEQKMALFFLDIRNFTPFIENNLPFDVIHTIRRLSIPFRRIIQEKKGKIIESAGDGFYAVFGLDGDVNEAVDMAVRAGFEILDELKNFNENYLAAFLNDRIEIGIGIHVGDVIVGTNGFAGNDTLTVMGLPVNIASRIEQSTKILNNNFVISEQVFEYLNSEQDYPYQHIKMKGAGEEIKIRMLGCEYN